MSLRDRPTSTGPATARSESPTVRARRARDRTSAIRFRARPAAGLVTDRLTDLRRCRSLPARAATATRSGAASRSPSSARSPPGRPRGRWRSKPGSARQWSIAEPRPL